MASCTGPLCLYSFFLLDGGPSGAASSQSWIPIKRPGRPLKEGPFFRIEVTLGYRSPLRSTSFSLYAFPSYFLFPYFWSSISDRIHQRHLGVMARGSPPPYYSLPFKGFYSLAVVVHCMHLRMGCSKERRFGCVSKVERRTAARGYQERNHTFKKRPR